MIQDKNELLIEKFNGYLSNNSKDTIIDELPKLLKAFKKLSTRTNKILKQSDSQQLEVLKLKEHIEDKSKRINTLLNNAGQGFLYFDSDMLIGPEYSKEVYNIFNIDVSNKKINELLYKDKSEATFLKNTLQDILKENYMKQDILISLLEKEFKIDNKFIEIEYKILNENKFMLILTDITKNKELAKKIKDEQQTLKMVIETVTSLEQFLEVKKDYLAFIDKIDSFKDINMLSELRKEIHTYKGLFAQKEMLNVVENLHQFESNIDNSLKNNILDEKITNTTKDIMNSWLEDDIKILKKILGNNFFDKTNFISLDKNRINKIVEKVKEIEKNNNSILDLQLSKEIKSLTYHHIELFFNPYKKLVSQLALRLEKYINPLILDIDEIYIPNRYIPFLNSLVHIFRNSVDHGIETLEDRYENGKDEYGTIKCSVKAISNKIIITISDDGSGIDLEKIKNVAIKKNLYTKEEINNLSEDDIIKIIFTDAFSTKDTITNISGRGVGLASIVTELENINGSMAIENSFGKGIKFTFILDYKSEETSKKEHQVLFVF